MTSTLNSESERPAVIPLGRVTFVTLPGRPM